MKQNCLKILAVSFSKNQSSLFCCNYFLFLFIAIITIITIVSLILILFIWLHFQFIVYDYYFTILLFIFSFLFILYFKFTFVPFFFICFLFCHFSFLVLQMSPSGASFACYYFYFYPYLPLVNSPRRTPRPSALPGNFMSLYLSLGLCLYYGSWAGQFHFSAPLWSFNRPSSERALSLTWLSRSHPIHPPGGAWE